MVGNLASWAHPGTIIGVEPRADGKSHGNHWLADDGADTPWHWVGCNPVHGTYHHGAHWALPVAELPAAEVVNSRYHAFFLLWGRPELRAGEPLTDSDIATVEAALEVMAQRALVRLDPKDELRVPVLDVLFRAQADGVCSWVSARDGDLGHEPVRQPAALAGVRQRLADPRVLARWAHRDGIAWGRPALHLPVPAWLVTAGRP
ncbi:hypothetical protein N8J89_16170 [Crossiella sp. CA-258035]|uniref:hypothetical protein n=1 Tax=Crossiella sp. CA-258035 TaxID=2981138 RepID=UPI0024BD2F9E|nr:hypothetical protein [Crossiella sp. CA-258035]WHT22536.1 hypothetical protein N8J89_16170 [Crossiella sp. CA-258035]